MKIKKQKIKTVEQRDVLIEELQKLEFKPKLEFNRWIKNEIHYDWLFFFNKKDSVGYGFNVDGKWFYLNDVSDLNYAAVEYFHDSNHYATDQEVEQALIKEAKKRGFKEGVLINNTKFYGGANNGRSRIEANDFSLDGNTLKIDGWMIFQDGKWAEITEQPKTLESRVKLLEKQVKNLQEKNRQ